MELLQTFEYNEFKVETFYNGTSKVPNKVYIHGKLVYEDNTFRPSQLCNIDDTETMVSLLGFHILRKGDVDDEFFEDRKSPDLLDWAENDEDVRMMLFDFDCRNESDYLKNNEITKKHCLRIEQYITDY